MTLKQSADLVTRTCFSPCVLALPSPPVYGFIYSRNSLGFTTPVTKRGILFILSPGAVSCSMRIGPSCSAVARVTRPRCSAVSVWSLVWQFCVLSAVRSDCIAKRHCASTVLRPEGSRWAYPSYLSYWDVFLFECFSYNQCCQVLALGYIVCVFKLIFCPARRTCFAKDEV